MDEMAAQPRRAKARARIPKALARARAPKEKTVQHPLHRKEKAEVRRPQGELEVPQVLLPKAAILRRASPKVVARARASP